MYYIVILYFFSTKPTRVTSMTATLIDHILTNNLDDDMMLIQGILCASIPDHSAVFHVASNAKKDHANTDTTVLKQNMGQRNIAKFISTIDMIDWQFVLKETDTQSAYNKFHEVISTKYYACFPYHKTSKNYYKINLGYIQLWKNQSKLRINCMWNRREAMKMCPSKEI